VRLTGGAALARTLAAAGVTDLFGVPAGKLGPFAKAVAEDGRFRVLGTRHEAAAAWMATAWFHGSGRIAACFGECGPGSLNLVSGLGTAFNNGLAVLAITTGNPSHLTYPFRGMFMDLDERRAFAAVTRWGATARSPAEIPSLVQIALGEALGGPPGPVHLELPADVLGAEAEFSEVEVDVPLSQILPAAPEPDQDAVARAAALLREAERPLVVAGGGVVHAGASPEVRAVAERLGAATTATQMGLGAVCTEDSRFVGQGGIVGGESVARALREADVVLAVGCRFSSWLWEGSRPLVGWPGQRLVQVDVDSARIGALVPADVGIVADAKLALGALLAVLGDDPPRDTSAWVTSLLETRDAHRVALIADDAGVALHPGVATAALADALPDDAIVVYDGGHTTFWSNDLIPSTEPRTRFHEPGMTHLGFGLPYSLALQLLHPERPVVNVTGDGAFGFTLAELDTARRYQLPVVNVVMNNASWGVIGFGQQRQGFQLGTALEGTRYAEIARAFGCHGEEVREADEIGPALERALASRVPAVIEVHVRFEPHPSLPRFAAIGRDA
jgi:thiamine pyrophosphate-dependent acetolactate synthase large subunit-like protein